MWNMCTGLLLLCCVKHTVHVMHKHSVIVTDCIDVIETHLRVGILSQYI